MLILNLPPVYLALVALFIFLIILIYIKNIRHELSEASRQTVKVKVEKRDVPPLEDEDDLGLIMAVAAYYYQSEK
ncbi:MAG TPA: hypothetical protein PLG67_11875 [Bacillota bacterium]|nr:hypothetical protein [Bacillota bacterium]